VHIRVLYQRDYLHLLVKYGLEPPSQLVDATAPGDAALPFELGPRPRTPEDVARREPFAS
jgi:hypothetical protein